MGRDVVGIDVAGVRFAVETTLPWTAAVAHAYAEFPSEQPDVVFVANPEVQAPLRPTGPATMVRRGATWLLSTPGLFEMRADTERGTGHIEFAAGPNPATRTPPEGLLSALKAFAVCRLVERGGLAVHACALDIDGRGALCIGPSGAGKSTLAGMFDESAVLGDELVAVMAGKLHATPFRGTSELTVRRQSVPLGHGFTLRQAETCAAHRIDSSESFRTLAQCLALPRGDRELEERAFQAALSLATENPWSRLSTTLDSGAVAGVIARQLASAP